MRRAGFPAIVRSSTMRISCRAIRSALSGAVLAAFEEAALEDGLPSSGGRPFAPREKMIVQGASDFLQ